MNKEPLFIANSNMPDEIKRTRIFRGFYVTNPHLVFFIFTPLAVVMALFSVFYFKIPLIEILIAAALSVPVWTIFEYCMHRFLFHFESENSFMKKFLYTVHHGHHDYPNDNRLMLVSPAISLTSYAAILGLVYLAFGMIAIPFMAGFAICYMFYDWLHYASHNYNFKTPVFQKLKKHHLRHHYRDDTKNFGFTSFVCDTFFKTIHRALEK